MSHQHEGVGLLRTGDLGAEVDALVARASPDPAGLTARVGLAGVLADLDRSARPTRVPGRAAQWAFTWDLRDAWSRRWFPQGITSSADADASELYAGRRVLCTSWYSTRRRGRGLGTRVTFVDITDTAAPRYRHVLLVEATLPEDGPVAVRPVQVHAGGIVWHAGYLHVASTWRGLLTFRLDDLVRTATGEYLLPLRHRWEAVTDQERAPVRHSFSSLDRTTSPVHLVVGEYGTGDRPTRLLRYALDPHTSLPATDGAGRARPAHVQHDGPGHMQGATVVDGTYYVNTSAGRCGRGSLWHGEPGRLTRETRVLPVGPEDLTYWPSTDRLWSLTEYPGRRYVYATARPKPTPSL